MQEGWKVMPPAELFLCLKRAVVVVVGVSHDLALSYRQETLREMSSVVQFQFSILSSAVLFQPEVEFPMCETFWLFGVPLLVLVVARGRQPETTCR